MTRFPVLRSLFAVGLVILNLSHDLAAANLYPVGIGNGSTTTNGDLLVFPGATLSVSSLPGGGRMVTLSGLTASGGNTSLALLPSNCVQILSIGGNTNIVAVDTNCIANALNIPGMTNGLITQTSLLAVSNFFANAGFVTIIVTNGLATETEFLAASNLAATANSTANTANGLASTALQPASTNGFISSILNGGESGSGDVAVDGNTATITFPAGSAVGGTNSVSSVQGALTGNVYIAVNHGSVTTSQSGNTGTATIFPGVDLVDNQTFAGSNVFLIPPQATNFWAQLAFHGGLGVRTQIVDLAGAEGRQWTNLITGNQVIILSNPPPAGTFAPIQILLPVSNGVTAAITFSNAPGSGLTFQPLNFINNGVPLPGGTTNVLTMNVWSNGLTIASLSISAPNYGTLWASNGVTSLTYAHTATDTGSGSGTLTANSAGGDLYVAPTSNLTGQAIVFSMDAAHSFIFKSDAVSTPQAKEFKIGPNTYPTVAYEVTWSLGKPGWSYDSAPPHRSIMWGMGFPWTGAGGYSSASEAANIIVDQFDNQSASTHYWYFGNNTNAPMFILKSGGYTSSGPTSTVQNSDWIGLQAWSSTNGLPHASGIALASNEDFFVIGFTRGMSTNCANNSDTAFGYSTNATDHLQIRTNDFIGAASGANGLFGNSYTNVKAWAFRDDTNGLMILSVLTNGLWIGTTNTLQQKQVISLP
ncbi:MAG TPA: hypothetical protein VMP11_20460 [Verrucomicrobiae bacterium]|nr:hypothetical protein [Verrucomicrobiae bacterium]